MPNTGLTTKAKLKINRAIFSLTRKPIFKIAVPSWRGAAIFRKKPKLKSSKVAKRSQKAISPTPPAKFTPTKTH
ncbi:hypothetical protein COI_0219 [Mannheimia haemolytica serotype A2 str. OVINE]|nr:hypothetical protein COI_0219 [Mannheimia haemolytica serotype A2 str. OVINE]